MSRYDFDPEDYRDTAPLAKQQPERKTEDVKPEPGRGRVDSSSQLTAIKLKRL